MPRKTLIFASSHRFSSTVRLGSAYLASAMAKRGWRVLYLEQPTSPFHIFHPRTRRVALDKALKAVRQSAGACSAAAYEEGVEVVNALTLVPHVDFPGFRSEFTLKNWLSASFPRIVRMVANRGFAEARAVVFDSPYFYPLVQALGLPSVYRYADRLERMSGVTGEMLKMQRPMLREVDLLLCTNSILAADAVDRSGPVLQLPNGVDIDRFSAPHQEPIELTRIAEPRVIYAGAMDKWFDAEALEFAVRMLPSVSFVLLGDARSLPASLREIPNVYPLGQVSFLRVPEFLQRAQVGIIPFDMNNMGDLVSAISPLKLYEYCAVGLPVVTYSATEFDVINAPVERYRSPQEFLDGIKRALSQDTEAMREERRNWAANASWDNRAASLETALESLRQP